MIRRFWDLGDKKDAELSNEKGKKRILIVGAGAVGSYIGGWLSHTGHAVVFADSWAAQVDAINSEGLRVEGPHDPFVSHPRAFHLHQSQLLALEPQFDLAFIAVKAYDTAWAARFAKRYVNDVGYFVSSQNCMPDGEMAEAVGAKKCVGLIMSSIAVRVGGSGLAQRAGTKRRRDIGHIVFRAGEHDGSDSNRIAELIEMLEPIDGGKTTTNLWGERWGKLCQNSMGNPVVGATLCGSATVTSFPRGRELQIRLASEAARVGLALGLNVVSFGGSSPEKWVSASSDGEVYEELDNMMAESAGATTGDWYPSMGQDVSNGRPSEIDFMNGHVVKMGREVGVDTPVTASIVEVMRQIDRGQLLPRESNIELILSNAGY